MKFRSLFSTCITTSTANSTTKLTSSPLPPPPPQLLSETSSGSTSSSADDTLTSYGSLQSNLSLVTLPSVPSLQRKLSPDDSSTLSVSASLLASLSPGRRHVINSISANGGLVYAASGSSVHVVDSRTLTLLNTFNSDDISSGSVKSVAFHGDRVFTAHQDCKIRVWRVEVKKLNLQHVHVATLPTVADRLSRLVLPRNYVKVRRHKKRLWIEHNDAVSGIAVVDERFLCSVSWDKCLKIWRCSDLKCAESIKAHDDAINAVVVAGDGTIYTGSADRRIKVWGKPYGEKKHVLIATLEKHKSAINALALNDDGSVLFSGACDRSILVWEKEDSANHMVVTGALRGHSKAILCLINVSELLFSGSADQTIRAWKRGRDAKFCCLTVLDGHLKPVRSLMAYADGNLSNGGITVFSGSFDGEIKVWKVTVSGISNRISSNLLKWS